MSGKLSEWSSLSTEQLRKVRQMLDHIDALLAENEALRAELAEANRIAAEQVARAERLADELRERDS